MSYQFLDKINFPSDLRKLKLTELEDPTITNIENGIKKNPKFTQLSFRKGIANPLNISGGEVSIIDIIAGIAINICRDNLIFPFKPEEELTIEEKIVLSMKI